CLCSGAGFATRELYSDDNEKLFSALRPVFVNGIDDLATRPDLLDRAITLTLPVIPDDQRRDEDELWAQFNQLRPGILGALLDAVSSALRNRPTVKLASKPRMSDFVSWVAAAESALGWAAGAFLDAYTDNRGAGNTVALEASCITGPLFALM